jgi:hypothetical protein
VILWTGPKAGCQLLTSFVPAPKRGLLRFTLHNKSYRDVLYYFARIKDCIPAP